MGRKKKIDTGGLHIESVKKAMDVMIKGHTAGEAKRVVIENRKAQGLTINDSYINKLISEANRRLTEDYGKNKNEVIAVHVERYNRDIAGLFRNIDELNTRLDKLQEMVLKSPNPDIYMEIKAVKYQIINAHYQILSTMLSKEKVLQMHTKSFQIFINNKVNMEVVQEINNFDISKLAIDEKIDFLNLLLKAKQNEFEVGTVILKGEVNKEETIDIDHEVIKEEEPNINKIERIEAPPTLTVAPPGMALQQATDKLALALQAAALKELKKAGSKSAENDEYRLQQMQPPKTDSK